MGNSAWKDQEVIEVLTTQVVELLIKEGRIARTLNEPVDGMVKDEILEALGYSEGEMPPSHVWASIRKRAEAKGIYLIGDRRGWFIGTSEHAALHKRSRVVDWNTRGTNIGAALAATPKGITAAQQQYLASIGKDTVIRRFATTLRAMGQEESASQILLALPPDES